MKNFEEVKTIIRWQITRDPTLDTIKIDQSVFIRDLVIKEGFINYKTTFISIKTGLAIDILDANDYKETKLYKYQ